jgi:adenylate kinase family enzyme
MERIMVIGGSGSGKSTMARWLGAQTGLPVPHLDHVHWMPYWTPRPEAERLAMVRAFEQEACWIIDGGISATYSRRLARAQMVIWLDLPVGQRLARVLRRSWRYRGGGRADLPEGCVEGFDCETFAFLKWIWDDREKGREQMREHLADSPAHVEAHHLRSSVEVEAFQRRFVRA